MVPGKLEDMDKDWFKTFVMGRNIHKARTVALLVFFLAKSVGLILAQVRDYFGERIALYFLFMPGALETSK